VLGRGTHAGGAMDAPIRLSADLATVDVERGTVMVQDRQTLVRMTEIA
jgi:hypothetical protein